MAPGKTGRSSGAAEVLKTLGWRASAMTTSEAKTRHIFEFVFIILLISPAILGNKIIFILGVGMPLL
jgi:hypothetical protein